MFLPLPFSYLSTPCITQAVQRRLVRGLYGAIVAGGARGRFRGGTFHRWYCVAFVINLQGAWDVQCAIKEEIDVCIILNASPWRYEWCRG